MSEYRIPARDMLFVLEHIADLNSVKELNDFEHADLATAEALIDEAGRFFSEVVAPLNRIGDQVGSKVVDGSVVTPDGFKDAYEQYVKAGWGGAHLPPEHGGGGLPYALGIAIQEMITSANLAFSLCPMLTQGAIDAVLVHGSDEQRSTYIEKMATGAWTGTMVLTEPEAGSDLGAMTARAEKQDDETYRVFGQKIFITWGDHDMAENIIHLVLARTPDSPPGTKGLSMFIVPKFLINADGTPGDQNDVKVVSVEHKLGIHASPTCVLSFGEEGGAVGHLLGDEQQGMRNMFTMMNAARVGVGLEGLAVTQRSFQQALDFATERVQGRSTGGSDSVTIINHPDVRRMLMTMKAYSEAMRALLYFNARALDVAHYGESAEARDKAGDLASLLTPISKAWPTDLGVEMSSIGIQVHGGMGYVEETGAAQYFRDSRIAPIYEGTNGIQAMDLVMRKLPIKGGRAIAQLLGQIESTVAELAAYPDLASIRSSLAYSLQIAAGCSRWLLERMQDNPNDSLAGASPYLKLMGTLLGGWVMAKSAIVATSVDDDWHRAKVATATFYCEQLLPQVGGLAPAVKAGAEPLFSSVL